MHVDNLREVIWHLERLAEYLHSGVVVDAGSSDIASETTLDALKTVANNLLTELEKKADLTETQPTQLYINKDGASTAVSLDTSAPYTTIPIPVAIVDITGTTPINVDIAGDLNVYMNHTADPVNGNFASTRIGDGTTLAGVTLTNDLKTYDSAIDAKIGTIGSAADVDGYITQQLRYIGEAVATLIGTTSPTSMGSVANTSISSAAATQITAASTPCKYCYVSCPHTNTGRITLGINTVTDGAGIILFPTDSMRIDISNVNLLYAIAQVNNEDIYVTYFN